MGEVTNPDILLHATPQSSIADEAQSIKRVFFRLKANRNDWTPVQIVNKYLEPTGLPLAKNFMEPHWIHEQPQEDTRIYHLILDVNSAASNSDVKIQEIPHELYRVHFNEGDRTCNPYVRNGSFAFMH